jgi:hypothetical protein
MLRTTGDVCKQKTQNEHPLLACLQIVLISPIFLISSIPIKRSRFSAESSDDLSPPLLLSRPSSPLSREACPSASSNLAGKKQSPVSPTLLDYFKHKTRLSLSEAELEAKKLPDYVTSVSEWIKQLPWVNKEGFDLIRANIVNDTLDISFKTPSSEPISQQAYISFFPRDQKALHLSLKISPENGDLIPVDDVDGNYDIFKKMHKKSYDSLIEHVYIGQGIAEGQIIRQIKYPVVY